MTLQPQIAVGTPHSRVDGRLKVTGGAPYAADHAMDGVVYAAMVDSSVGRGRITGIETSAAEAAPGVLRVVSHLNAPRLPYRDSPDANNPPGTRLPVVQDDQVRFFGQPVAVVVADSLEAAQHAARLVEVSYDAAQPSTDLASAPADEPEVYERGDADAALGAAEVRLEMTYRTARNHHNPMEPHATIARWDGDQLTVWDKTQWVGGTQRELAAVFGIPDDAVHVISPFVGGAFGSALRACGPGHTSPSRRSPRVRRAVRSNSSYRASNCTSGRGSGPRTPTGHLGDGRSPARFADEAVGKGRGNRRRRALAMQPGLEFRDRSGIGR